MQPISEILNKQNIKLIVLTWLSTFMLMLFLELIIRWAKSLSPTEGTVPAVEPAEIEETETPAKKLKSASVKSRYLVQQVSGTPTYSNTVRAQLDKYLTYNHGELSVNEKGEVQEINLFAFWTKTANEMPALAKLARLVLSVPASSAPVERVFSHAGLIFRPHRRSMADSNLSLLIYLKVNRLKSHDD